MAMATVPFANALLGLLFNNTNIAGIGDGTGIRGSSTAGNWYFSACTAFPGDTPASGQATNEATYTGYVRASAARDISFWGSPGGGSINPGFPISFGERTDSGAAQTLYYWIMGDASSGNGTARMWGVFGDSAFAVRPFVSDSAANDTFFVPAHGLAADDRIAFFDPEFGGALPGGITGGDIYWVISGGLTTDQFKVSTTQGGGAVNITAVGSGYCAQVKPVVVTQNVEPKLKTATLIHIA